MPTCPKLEDVEIGAVGISSENSRSAIIYSDGDSFEGGFVQFRLLYYGRLLASSKDKTRPEHKHEIRCLLSPQLEKLWELDQNLQKYRRAMGHRWANTHPEDNALCRAAPDDDTAIKLVGSCGVKWLANNWERAKQGFIPLVSNEMGLRCKLDILFLRPGTPGQIIGSGDIDNRIKTLFDALKVPENAQAMGNAQAKTEPIYCLLEDDSLVSELRVVTDNLLRLPNETELGTNDVFLVVEVSLESPPNTQWSYIF
jgi:hypothetical protein